MKNSIPTLVCSFVMLIGASSCIAQNYSRSSSQSWNSSFNSATDKTPKTSYSHSDTGWGKIPNLPSRTMDFRSRFQTNFPDHQGQNQKLWLSTPNFNTPNFGNFGAFPSFKVPSFKAESVLGPLKGTTSRLDHRNLFAWSNVSVDRVLENIARLSRNEIRLTRKAWLKIRDSDKRITMKVSSVSVKNLLASVLRELDLAVIQNDNSVLISVNSGVDQEAESFELEDLVRPMQFHTDFKVWEPIFETPFPFELNPPFQFRLPMTAGFAR